MIAVLIVGETPRKHVRKIYRTLDSCIDSPVIGQYDSYGIVAKLRRRQRRKEGTFCASDLAGIEPTPPAPKEQGIPAFVS